MSSHPGRAKLVVVGGPPGKTWIALGPEQVRDWQRAREERARSLPADDPAATLREAHVSDVELVTLDGLVEAGVVNPDGAGMLWIDVEGHEGHVLAGAKVIAGRGLPIVFEFDPATLESRGDREMVHAVVEEHYTHFIDLRRREADRRDFAPRPVAELRGLGDRYGDLDLPGRFTDILTLRLDAD